MWQGRVSVVTGATSGIGRAMALELARRGCSIIGVGRDDSRLASLAEELAEAGGTDHQLLQLNVGSEQDMAQLTAAVEARGRADLCVASAVMKTPGFPPRTKDLSLADWQAQIDVNLYGVVLANQAVLPTMLAAGEGEIVNMSSSTTPKGLRGTPLAPAYCATKFAIAELCRAMAEELGPEGINVRAVFPGSIDTPLIADTMLDGPYGGKMSVESFAAALVGLIELGREMVVPDPFLLPVPQKKKAGLART